MKRYNLFHQVHQGLRCLLFETALEGQRVDLDNPEDLSDYLEKIENVILLFEKHAETEDTIVFNCLAEQEPFVVSDFNQEHDLDREHTQKLKNLIELIRNEPNISSRNNIIAELLKAFNAFICFNLGHMAKEEEVINNLLWRYFSDAELRKVTQKIVTQLPPVLATEYCKWMIRGLRNKEIAAWLTDVKNNAPEIVFHSLMEQAQRELPPSQWVKLQESLIEGAQLA